MAVSPKTAAKPNTTPPKPAAQEVVAQKPAGTPAVETQLPDFMRAYVGQGTEALSSADYETPRIKLLQALSPECEEFEEARPGHFWHATLNMSLGKSFLFTPIYTDMRAILWRPRPEGGILARSDDGVHWSPPNASFDVKLEKTDIMVTWRTRPTVAASGLLEWGSSNPNDPSSAPAATRMYNMFLIPTEDGMPPGVFTMQRSMIKNARKFFGKLKMAGAPSYGCIYEMSSYLDDNNSGQKYHNVKFEPKGFVQDQATFERNRSLYDGLKAKGLNITDIETMQTVETEAGDTIDANAPAY